MFGATDRLLDFADRAPLAKTAELTDAALAVDAAARKLCAGLSEAELCWSPRPGKWSIAQNLAHLRVTTEAFLPVVDSALDSTRILGLRSEGPFDLSPFGRLVVWRLDARPLIKMRAPKALLPRLSSSSDSELQHFLASQAAFRLRIEQAEGLDLTARRFSSPVAHYFRVNLLEFFSAFNAHSRRHLWQAENIRRKIPSIASRNRA